MYEAVEFIDSSDHLTAPPEERLLGTFTQEEEAIAVARSARRSFDHPRDYGWWIVRSQGETLARWIADSRTHKEFALDLTTGELVEVR